MALCLLEDNKVEFKIFLYLEEEITDVYFTKVLKLLNMKPRDVMRSQEKVYKENDLDNQSFTDSELIEVMLKNPKLIERPIVINGQKAIIARPPEKLLEILWMINFLKCYLLIFTFATTLKGVEK